MNRLFLYVLLFFLFVMLLNGCNNYRENNQEEVKIIIAENAFKTIDSLNKKASNDTAFKNSEAYAMQMERVNIEMAKNNHDLNQSAMLLFEFEIAIKNLKQATTLLKQNKALSKNMSFMAQIRTKADKVREYQQMIKKSNLTTEEKKKYDELCRQ